MSSSTIAMEPFSWKRKSESLTPAAPVFNEDEESSSDEEYVSANQSFAKISPEKRQKIANISPTSNKESVNKEQRAIALGEEAVKLAEEGQFEKALYNFNQSLQLKPDARLFEMHAQVLNEMGKYFEAIQACEKAIKLDPNWSTALHTLGRCQFNFMQPEMAVTSLKKAVHLNPSEPEAWQDLTVFFKHWLKMRSSQSTTFT